MHVAVFVSGIAAVMSQTLLMRESLAFFAGNELISGIILFFWLLWTGLGSILYSKWKPKLVPVRAYALLLFLLCFTLVFSLIFFRIAPIVFSLPFGEMVGFERIILISIITLCPTGLVFGALFPAASSIIMAQKVYLIEGFGSFAGGLLFSFFLVSVLPPFGILVIIISLLLFAELFCLRKKLMLILCLLPLVLLIKIDDIEFFFRKVQVHGQQLVGLYESIYGTIAITRMESQLNFYFNGFFDFAYPDNYSAEEAVHYPLLIHKMPESVLLIGGGMGGAIGEIMKYRTIKRLVYLEIDPKLVEVGRKYIPELNDDNNIKIIINDARFYLKNTIEQFDCIILNLPDPMNAQLNRYYTKEFFKEAKQRLKKNGLFSIRVTTPQDIISPLYSQFLTTIYNTLKEVYKNVLALPVAKTTFISMDYYLDEDIAGLLKKMIAERKLKTLYVNSYFIDYNLTQERIEYLKMHIKEGKRHLNRDLKPVCYYFNSVIWGGIISQHLRNIFVKFFNLNPIFYFLPLALVFLLFWKLKPLLYLSVFSIGASEISGEVILIILFQIFYGYIYAWLGAIISFFMLGLTTGTIFFLKSMYFKEHPLSKLSYIQFFVGFYFLLVLLFSFIKLPISHYIIGLLIFIDGFLGGLHFPLSMKIIGEEKAGIIYGIDLLGSGIGAILTTILLIPILGIPITLLIFVILNILVGIKLKIHLLPQTSN
ncbi:MAG: methyltransferase [bacterium]